MTIGQPIITIVASIIAIAKRNRSILKFSSFYGGRAALPV
jgi:hypothetical protein